MKTNKTIKKLILILIVLAAITEGCKKYPDGPCISFRSPIKRLYGVYTLTKHTVNGEDSLSLYKDSLGQKFDFFYNDIEDFNSCIISGNRMDGYYCYIKWDWRLVDKNKILQIFNSDGTIIGTGPFGKRKKPEWEIIRLTNKELYMKTTFNGKEYYVELRES